MSAWIIIQVFDAVFEAWGLPDTAMRYVFLAAILGFPLALVFGWKFDLTAKGIVRIPDSGQEDYQQLKSMDYLLLAVIIGVFGFVVFRFADFAIREPGVPENPAVITAPVQEINPNSVAVMPFVNMSDDPANAYFSDGISEELRNSGFSHFGKLSIAILADWL